MSLVACFVITVPPSISTNEYADLVDWSLCCSMFCILMRCSNKKARVWKKVNVTLQVGCSVTMADHEEQRLLVSEDRPHENEDDNNNIVEEQPETEEEIFIEGVQLERSTNLRK